MKKESAENALIDAAYDELIVRKILAESDRTLAREFLRRNKVGRNKPCPCGSGRKFKHCCIKELT